MGPMGIPTFCTPLVGGGDLLCAIAQMEVR